MESILNDASRLAKTKLVHPVYPVNLLVLKKERQYQITRKL